MARAAPYFLLVYDAGAPKRCGAYAVPSMVDRRPIDMCYAGPSSNVV